MLFLIPAKPKNKSVMPKKWFATNFVTLSWKFVYWLPSIVLESWNLDKGRMNSFEIVHLCCRTVTILFVRYNHDVADMITESNDDSDKFCHCVFDLWRPLLLERMMSWQSVRKRWSYYIAGSCIVRNRHHDCEEKGNSPRRWSQNGSRWIGVCSLRLFRCTCVRSPAVFSRASRIYQMMTRGDIAQIVLDFGILSLQRMYMWLHVRLCHRPDTIRTLVTWRQFRWLTLELHSTCVRFCV